MQVIAKICDALKGDSRVSDLQRPTVRPEWTTRYRMYPQRALTTSADLRSGEDHFHAVSFSDPILFKVSVPRRNQPAFRGYDDFPSDDYWVAWDGIVTVVLWEQPEAMRIPRAGGHVVVSVLQDAVAQAGFELYVQACSPNCHNLFVHSVLEVLEDARLTEETTEARPRVVTVRTPSLLSPKESSESLYLLTALLGDRFAEFKNGARRIRDLEMEAREQLQGILAINQMKAQATALPVWRWSGLRGRWQLRAWRRELGEALANMWVVLAELEMRQRRWNEVRGYFHKRRQSSTVGDLLNLDFADDESAIDGMNLDLVRTATENTAARLDNHVIAYATAASAAAALLGAAVGGALS